MTPLIGKALAEMAGTFMMVFVGGGSIVLVGRFPSLFPPLCIPVAWGLIICLMIMLFGGISGAHFNPAVTLAFAVAKKLPTAHLLVYWFSQFLGGITAVLVLMVIQKT